MVACEQPLQCLVERQAQGHWGGVCAKGATLELNLPPRRFPGERESLVF